MSALRISVEWAFGYIVQMYPGRSSVSIALIICRAGQLEAAAFFIVWLANWYYVLRCDSAQARFLGL